MPGRESIDYELDPGSERTRTNKVEDSLNAHQPKGALVMSTLVRCKHCGWQHAVKGTYADLSKPTNSDARKSWLKNDPCNKSQSVPPVASMVPVAVDVPPTVPPPPPSVMALTTPPGTTDLPQPDPPPFVFQPLSAQPAPAPAASFSFGPLVPFKCKHCDFTGSPEEVASHEDTCRAGTWICSYCRDNFKGSYEEVEEHEASCPEAPEQRRCNEAIAAAAAASATRSPALAVGSAAMGVNASTDASSEAASSDDESLVEDEIAPGFSREMHERLLERMGRLSVADTQPEPPAVRLSDDEGSLLISNGQLPNMGPSDLLKIRGPKDVCVLVAELMVPVFERFCWTPYEQQLSESDRTHLFLCLMNLSLLVVKRAVLVHERIDGETIDNDRAYLMPVIIETIFDDQTIQRALGYLNQWRRDFESDKHSLSSLDDLIDVELGDDAFDIDDEELPLAFKDAGMDSYASLEQMIADVPAETALSALAGPVIQQRKRWRDEEDRGERAVRAVCGSCKHCARPFCYQKALEKHESKCGSSAAASSYDGNDPDKADDRDGCEGGEGNGSEGGSSSDQPPPPPRPPPSEPSPSESPSAPIIDHADMPTAPLVGRTQSRLGELDVPSAPPPSQPSTHPATPTGGSSAPISQASLATIGDGVEVKKSWIAAAGDGAFVTKGFAKGDIITEYDHDHDGLLNQSDVARLLVQIHVLTLEPKHAYLDGIRTPSPGCGAASFANDCFSCLGDPLPQDFEGTFQYNAEIVKSPDESRMNRAFLRALRPLKQGEEIFFRYENPDLPMGWKRLSTKTLGSQRVADFEDALSITHEEENAMVEYAAAVEQLKRAKEATERAKMQVELCNRRCSNFSKDERELRKDASKAERDAIVQEKKEATMRLREAKDAVKAAGRDVETARERVDAAAVCDYELRECKEDWTTLNETKGFLVVPLSEHGIEFDATGIRCGDDITKAAGDGSGKRLMGHLQGRSTAPSITALQDNVRNFMQRRRWLRTSTGTDASKAFLHPTETRALKSEAGCPKQKRHADSADRNSLRDEPWGDVPKVALLFPEGGELHIYPFDEEGEVTLTLGAGDLVVFCGDLGHAGAAYEVENVRGHVYIDSHLIKRKLIDGKTATFFF